MPRCCVRVVCLLIFGVSLLCAQTVTRGVLVGTNPSAIAANPATNKIYVVNAGSSDVTVIDGATNKTTTIKLDAGLNSVAINSVTNQIYVASTSAGAVWDIDGNTNTAFVGGIGLNPDAVAVNPVTNTVYVAFNDPHFGPMVEAINGTTGTLKAIVPTGNAPYALAVNTVTNEVYVANYMDKSVNVIDGFTNTTTKIPVGTSPDAIAVNVATNRIYVANLGGGVTVIDGSTHSTTTVNAGLYPYAVAIDSVTDKIYVANEGSASVTVIDGATNATSTVPVGVDPRGLTINPLTNQIYVANFGGGVTVIDGATHGTKEIRVGDGPQAIAFNPVTNQVYVANSGSGNVTVIDGAPNNTTTVSNGVGPAALAINPLTDRIYVADREGDACCSHLADASITVIHGETNSTDVVIGGIQPTAVATNPVTNKTYVANGCGNTPNCRSNGTVTVVDGVTNSTATITVGVYPNAVAVNPVTNMIYVANTGGDVTVIDGLTNGTTTVKTGFGLSAVAVNPVTNKIYVCVTGSGEVTVIDGATNNTITLATGSPVALAVNPITNKIYVADYVSSKVTVIDGATNSMSTVPAGVNQVAVDVNPVTNKIYVVNAGNDSVTVIDGDTLATATVAAGTQPSAIVVNPVTNKIYVANSQNGATLIDGATNTATTVPAGANSGAVAVNRVTDRIYVANECGGGSCDSGSVTVIDGRGEQGVPIGVVVLGIKDTQTISGLAMFATKNASPTFLARVTSSYAPSTPAPLTFYYQLDTANGAWMTATRTSSTGVNPAYYHFSLANVPLGVHTVYVYALCGTEISNVGSYAFEIVGTPQTPATMISPTSGSLLTGSSATFTWTPGEGVAQYSLYIGSTPGSNNLGFINAGSSTSANVGNLPTDGGTLFVTLYSLINGKYRAETYSYVEAGIPTAAVMSSPTPGSKLASASATFSWTKGTGVTQYTLYVGTTVGAHDIAFVNAGTNTSATVSDIPMNGGTFYVTLYSLIDGSFEPRAYTYIAAGTPARAAMISPANDSTLTGTDASFKWTAGTGVTSYALYIGTSPGSHDLDYVPTTATSAEISNLPALGLGVYVRLYSYIDGDWQYNDYSYTNP